MLGDVDAIRQGATLFETLNRSGVTIPMNSISNRHRQIIIALQNLVRLTQEMSYTDLVELSRGAGMTEEQAIGAARSAGAEAELALEASRSLSAALLRLLSFRILSRVSFVI